MKSFVKVLILALVAAGTWVATAEQGFAMLHNQNDKNWEAINTQGNLVLTGKYGESLQNGMIEQELEAELEHVRPGTRVTFSVDGRVVGTVTVDNSREARLDLRMVVAPGPDGRPTGPRVNDGSILTASVGSQSLSAVFVPVP